MNTEKMIAKGVEKHFDGQKVLFKIESLKEHFDGLLIHETDIEEIDGVGYVIAGDVNFDNATDNKFQRKSKVAEEIKIGMTYDEAEKLMEQGELIALPEWGGFWFKNIKTNEINVYTKDNVITNTPFGEFKDRNDWIIVEATPEQKKEMKDYFAYLEVPSNEIEIVVTQETLDMNPELVEEGIEVGEIITIDAAEDFPVWVNAETEVVEPEVVEPEIVAPEVIISETPAEIVVIEEVVAPVKASKKKSKK